MEDELLPFVFADAEDERQQYTMVIHNVVRKLKLDGEPVGDDGAWRIEGETIATYHDLVELIVGRLSDDMTMVDWAGRAVGGRLRSDRTVRLDGSGRRIAGRRRDRLHPRRCPEPPRPDLRYLSRTQPKSPPIFNR